MLFTTHYFLKFFLPIVFVVYLMVHYYKKYPTIILNIIPYIKKHALNIILLISSIVFYATLDSKTLTFPLLSVKLWYALCKALFPLCLIILITYIATHFIVKTKHKKVAIYVSIILELLILFIYKYSHFLMPVGISFFTFRSISYLVDTYKISLTTEVSKEQTDFVSMALYISFFPQVLSGPISKSHDFIPQLNNRQFDVDNIYHGIKRFILGFIKKVMIADFLSSYINKTFDSQHTAIMVADMSGGFLWLLALSYALLIYYDFSSYTDMAIGLSMIFGFKCVENFNFPYIAKSVNEFWERWHISLTNWFREYLYIPLGGNRKGTFRTYMNIFAIFFISGIWHGSTTNFIIWGCVHGFFIIVERLFLGEILKKLPSVFSHVYMILFIVLSWLIFKIQDINVLKEVFSQMFNVSNFNNSFNMNELYLMYPFLNIYYVYLLGIAILFCIPIHKDLVTKIKKYPMIEDTVYILLFMLSIYTTNNSAAASFIYFQF